MAEFAKKSIEQKPIFITGTDRSGTSLMYALLASHPNLSMVRRTNMWRWFYGHYGDLRQPENFERCLSTMLRYKRLAVLQPDPERIRREFSAGEPTYGRLFALLHMHHAERLGRARWGDKSLHTEHHADALFREFPHAKVIHMMRDPRDRYTSVVRRYDPGEAKGISAAMGRWMASARSAQRNLRRYPDRYMVVRYETLAHHPVDTLRTVCRFIDEPYTETMLYMQGAPEHGEEGGNSSFERFEPGEISTRSIGRFRSVLPKQDIAYIQLLARRGMWRFDYLLDTVELSKSERLSFLLRYIPVNLARLAGWFLLDKMHAMRGKTVPAHRLSDGVSLVWRGEQAAKAGGNT